MNYLRGAVSATYQYYKDINPSTLTGAIDVIVVRRQASDGDIHLACSPFHVRFGKLQVLRPADKKVNVFVNGNPIPFGMKIGDAGEAFFVVETEEDIPEDLVTSPLLTATSTTPQKDIPPVASTAESSQGAISQIGADSDIPEPEFLDLDATPSEQAMSRRPCARSVAQSNDVSPVLPEDECAAPDVQYKDDVALDMAGYHSAPSQSKWHHGNHSNQRIPHHPYESKETAPHNRIPFPSPEPSRDHPTRGGNSTPPRLREHSWERGAFLQPSPVQTHFTPSFVKGKSKAIDDTQDDSEDSGRGLTRCRSVPPELEGSPRSTHVSLPPPGPDADSNVRPHERSFSLNTESYELGAGGRLAASRSDPTKFRISIDGKTAAFKLSLVERREVFHKRDEVETARAFEAGVIDYHRFVDDDDLVSDERLVMKWNGGQYITREDRSPLMNALGTWRASSSQEGLIDDLPPPSSPQDQSPSSSYERESERPEFGPTIPFPRKSSSSWVRWWSRSKDIPEAESPILRGATAIPLHANFPRTAPTIIGKPASAPPGTPVLTQSPVPKPVDQSIPTKPETQKRYAKTLRLTSDQLKALDLKLGANAITFSLTTGGAPACTARIFVWESTDRIVVSDIDGTITKSDGLGHIFTMIGRDWTHSGVAKLYSDIVRNGYKIMYLTSRAIGQADSTRDYLKGIKQDDLQLPEGPVILSPDRVIASLHREVIMRKPEVFKMACLRDIQRLFGDGSQTPFYAGFGNRITDALSYRSVSVPSSRIFTIDSSSTVKMELLELAGYKSSYIHMTDLVDQMFPPIHRKWETEFTCFNFWKIPVQEFPLPDLIPPSPALSARSDTSARNAFARLRNFSIGGKQSVSLSTPSLIRRGTGTDTGTGTPAEAGTINTGGSGALGERSTHLRQMSSFEKLSSRLASLALSSSPSTLVESGEESPRSRSSVSSTMLDSDEEAEREMVGGTLKKERRPRSTSVTSMPGSLDNGMHFAMDEDEEETREYDEEENGDEYVEEAAEEEFDRDFLATTEMMNVPFL
ncbi:LNS2-domain-containing protein [Pisolithus microcarpus]|nr:LNS2-domain-containing protein [Pisolithus microcarpus]